MEDSKTDGRVPVSPTESAHQNPARPIAQAVQVEVDDSKSTAHYTNRCRLLGLPEELLMDFGLNPEPMNVTTQPIILPQRVVVGWHTAKRLVHVLQLTIDRHEAAFGVLETDVQKRVRRA